MDLVTAATGHKLPGVLGDYATNHNPSVKDRTLAGRKVVAVALGRK